MKQCSESNMFPPFLCFWYVGYHGSNIVVFPRIFKVLVQKNNLYLKCLRCRSQKVNFYVFFLRVFEVFVQKHRKPHAWIREQLSKSVHLPDPTHAGTKYARSGEPLTPISEGYLIFGAFLNMIAIWQNKEHLTCVCPLWFSHEGPTS